MPLALLLAAGILAAVRQVQARGADLLAWAVICIVLSLTWGRF